MSCALRSLRFFYELNLHIQFFLRSTLFQLFQLIFCENKRMPDVVMSKVMPHRSTLPRLSARRRHETRVLESLHTVPHSSRSNPPVRRVPLNFSANFFSKTVSISSKI